MQTERQFGDPATLTALIAASDDYEAALAQNDITMLDSLFHDGPETIRFGATENLFGSAEIAAFRRARTGGAPPRRNIRRDIAVLSADTGCVSIVFERVSDGRIGRQTQTWQRQAGGWRVMVAHVSLLPASPQPSPMPHVKETNAPIAR